MRPESLQLPFGPYYSGPMHEHYSVKTAYIVCAAGSTPFRQPWLAFGVFSVVLRREEAIRK